METQEYKYASERFNRTWAERTTEYSNVRMGEVRSYLTKKGFSIGHSSTNGRIKGLGEFHGGNVEVTKAEINRELVKTEKLGERWYRYFEEVSGVRVSVYNASSLYEEVTLKELYETLKEGFECTLTEREIIVTNKKENQDGK